MENLLNHAKPFRSLKMRRSTDITGVGRFSVNSPEAIASSETCKTTSNQESARSSSNFKIEIYAAYMHEPVDRDRSLPTTPISETPMVSPFL